MRLAVGLGFAIILTVVSIWLWPSSTQMAPIEQVAVAELNSSAPQPLSHEHGAPHNSQTESALEAMNRPQESALQETAPTSNDKPDRLSAEEYLQEVAEEIIADCCTASFPLTDELIEEHIAWLKRIAEGGMPLLLEEADDGSPRAMLMAESALFEATGGMNNLGYKLDLLALMKPIEKVQFTESLATAILVFGDKIDAVNWWLLGLYWQPDKVLDYDTVLGVLKDMGIDESTVDVYQVLDEVTDMAHQVEDLSLGRYSGQPFMTIEEMIYLGYDMEEIGY